MAEFEDFLKDVFKVKVLKGREFKKITITDKTLYFIYQSSYKVKNNHVISYNLSPIAFIMETSEDFFYYSLNGEKMDEDLIERFVSEFKA